VARAWGRACRWFGLLTLPSPVGGVRAVFMLERKPFALLASASLADASCGPFITIMHSSIGLGSVGAVACEA
jgi:hypothetical protein